MVKLQLHKPHGNNRYCGPTALSAITGFSTDECAAVVRLVNPNKPAVKGMQDWEFIGAIKAMGGLAVHAALPSPAYRRTFAQWLDSRGEYRERIMVATAGWHYMTVLRDLMVCSMTKRELVHVGSAPHRNHQFKGAIMVTPPTKWRLPPGIAAAKRTQRAVANGHSKARAEARKLMPMLHLEIEKDDGRMIVQMADSGVTFWHEVMLRDGGTELTKESDAEDVNEAFYSEVLDGDSYAHDWSEVGYIVRRVADYVHKVTGIRVDGRRGLIG